MHSLKYYATNKNNIVEEFLYICKQEKMFLIMPNYKMQSLMYVQNIFL